MTVSAIPSTDPILSPKRVAEKLGCSRESLYRWIKAGILPRPIRIGHLATGWKTSTIEAWLSQREGMPMQPRKSA